MESELEMLQHSQGFDPNKSCSLKFRDTKLGGASLLMNLLHS